MQKEDIKGAWLTVNRDCNFRCKWCYAEGACDKGNDDMELKLAFDLLQILEKLEVWNISLIGGEPTLWPHLFDVLSWFDNSKITSTLITNGYMFGVDKFWDRYQSMPASMAGLSLKAGNETQYRELAGLNNYRVLLKGLKRFFATYPDQGGIQITYNKCYQQNLPEIVQLAVECGAENIQIDLCSVVLDNNEPVTEYFIEPRQVVKDIMKFHLELMRITNNKIAYSFNIPLCLWPSDFLQELVVNEQVTTTCHIFYRNSVIFDPAGKLIMCNELFDYPIGEYGVDFVDVNTLIKLLGTTKVNGYYDQFCSYPTDGCKQCILYSKCGGGCPVQWVALDPNDYVKPILEGGEYSWINSLPKCV